MHPAKHFRPADWHQPKKLCLAWPYDKNLWGDNLVPAQSELLALIKALKDQALLILVPNQSELMQVKTRLGETFKIEFKIMAYGDIWLRDTMPIMLLDRMSQAGEDRRLAFNPKFNGWGEKYLFCEDLSLRARLAQELGLSIVSSELVLEGGAIECDGQGTMITTEQCLLNANRNLVNKYDKNYIETEFNNKLNINKIIWLKEGLLNDHTDGHVDNIARFLAPATVVIMSARDKYDPNARILEEITASLVGQRDACGRELKIIELPSPGPVLDQYGELMPASYLNFIIGERVLVMPTYESVYDQEALEILRQNCDLPVTGLSARAILSGGGGFHCISQELFI